MRNVSATERQARRFLTEITALLLTEACQRTERVATRTDSGGREGSGKHEFQKFLAPATTLLQDRSAMSSSARSANHGYALVATCNFAAFLWALALSASPQLHQRVHPDAGHPDHTCLVTAIASGNCDYTSHPPLISAPLPAVEFSTIRALTPQWVESLFLKAHIFAHAPPALG